MRRVHAILAVLALLAAPLALLARAGACEKPCCEALCCAAKHSGGAKMAQDSGAGTLCHRQVPANAADSCYWKSLCNHSLDYGFASPLPPTVLTHASSLAGPQPGITFSSASEILTNSGFALAPFQPPRS